jgi:hypothetical protein
MRITASPKNWVAPEVPIGHRITIDRLPEPSAKRPCAYGQGRGSRWERGWKSLRVRWETKRLRPTRPHVWASQTGVQNQHQMNQLKTAFWMVAMTVLLVIVGRLLAGNAEDSQARGDGGRRAPLTRSRG